MTVQTWVLASLATAGALVVVLGICALAWLAWRSRLAPLPPAQQRALGAAASVAQVHQEQAQVAVPRVVWTYWHEAQLPLVVARCIEGWRRLNPQYVVHVLHAGNLTQFLDEVPPTLARLNIAKQTDWVRLALLHRHGGIWMDASILLTQPLDWVEQLRAHTHAEFVGFYLDGYTSDARYPVIESWFLAALPGSRFIAEWLELFRREAIDGDTANYLARLRQEERHVALAQKIGDPAYHTIHVAAQDVLQRHAPDAAPWRLTLLRAEDSAYWLQWQSGWKRRPLFARLLWARGDAAHWPALVKLRGGERRKLEAWLRHQCYRKGSLVAQALGPPG